MSSYFTPELFQFLTRLKRNNKRDWFQAHQKEWEHDVRQPVLRFITDFAAPLYEVAPHLVADPRPSRGSMFRIYRDTRFSHDKRPYKTHVAMRFSHRGKDVHSPGFYLHLEPGGCFAACGLWHPEPEILLKVRNAIVSRPKEWRAVRKLLNWDDAGKLRRPPRGFPADHEFVEDLKLRDLGTAVNFSEKQVCSPRFMPTFVAACRTMSPVAAFLSNALVLLCYKRRDPQKGQPESCRSRTRAMVCRSVAIDQGLCRSTRTGRTPRAELERHFGDG